jgi:predicted transcriptional regulator
MKTISLKLPDAFDAKLTSIAQQRGTSKSALIRDALETFLRNKGDGGKDSALAQARDLAGCLAGPADLSVNKDYLQGFGR